MPERRRSGAGRRTRAGLSNPPVLVLSCEHGGNRVPPRWRGLFRGAAAVLESHRGWDPGALDLARAMSRRLDVPLISTTVTRLLVETNRSARHPRLFSEFTRDLPSDEREELLARYWAPHRDDVHAAVSRRLRGGGTVLHVGVHSFTPVLDGVVREVDVGVLYDPARPRERAFCSEWIRALRATLPDVRVRANQPYRGASDGLTTHLRRELGDRYLGVELEVGQGLLARGPAERRRVLEAVTGTLAMLTRGTGGRVARVRQRPAAASASAVARGRQRPAVSASAVAPASAAGRAPAPKRTTPSSGW